MKILVPIFILLCSASFTFQNETVMLQVTAINLSEDMNLLSSGNDEVFLFLFNESDTAITPIVKREMAFDALHRKDSLSLSINLNDSITLFLIEEDSDRNLDQLETLVCPNKDSLITFYQNTQYKKIEQLIGSDDVLYAGPLHSDTTVIEGIHKVDRYKYLISFER